MDIWFFHIISQSIKKSHHKFKKLKNMKKNFTKVLCSLLLLAAFNPIKAQVLTYNPNEDIQIEAKSYETRGGNWLHYDDGDFSTGIGGPQSFSWGVMFPSSKLNAGQNITKVSFFDYIAHDGFVNIYYGGTSKPDVLVHKQAFSTFGSEDFVEVELTAPLPIFEGDNLWIVLSTDNGDTYPAAMADDCGDKNSRWVSLDGKTWEDLKTYSLNGSWMIRVYIEGEESISELNSSLNIFPNPAKDQLFIETEAEIEEVNIYDVYGRQMTTVYDQQTVNVSELSNGVYFVKVKSENNEVVKRFIKK